MNRVFPDCTCDQCFHSGPTSASDPECPFAKAFDQYEHERELEADEARQERRKERFMTLGRQIAGEVAAGVEAGTWTTEESVR